MPDESLRSPISKVEGSAQGKEFGVRSCFLYYLFPIYAVSSAFRYNTWHQREQHQAAIHHDKKRRALRYKKQDLTSLSSRRGAGSAKEGIAEQWFLAPVCSQLVFPPAVLLLAEKQLARSSSLARRKSLREVSEDLSSNDWIAFDQLIKNIAIQDKEGRGFDCDYISCAAHSRQESDLSQEVSR